MVTITKTKLIIEIEHVCPDDLFLGIRDSLLYHLQHITYDELSVEEVKSANYFVLELLKEIQVVKGGVKR